MPLHEEAFRRAQEKALTSNFIRIAQHSYGWMIHGWPTLHDVNHTHDGTAAFRAAFAVMGHTQVILQAIGAGVAP